MSVALETAKAERLTLLVADNKAGYFGVHFDKSCKTNPFKAGFRRSGTQVSLGCFATAEEAALCIARSPEGQAAAAERGTAAPPLTAKEARQQAQAERLTLRVAKNTTGFHGVYSLTKPGHDKYQARVTRGGKVVSLGTFATAEEASLCVARSPEGRAAARRAAAAPPLTSKEARQQAQAEGLTLRVAETKAGYYGVHLKNPGHPKPYEAQVRRGGKNVRLGSFVTAEEAALSVARLEGEKTAAVLPARSKEALQQVEATAKLVLRVADNRTGPLGKRLDKRSGRSTPYQVKRGGERTTLGQFVTAEEAALCVTQTPEEQPRIPEEAALCVTPTPEEQQGIPAVLPPRSKEALQQAQAEGLVLRVADTKTGYFGVYHRGAHMSNPGKLKPKPIEAKNL